MEIITKYFGFSLWRFILKVKFPYAIQHVSSIKIFVSKQTVDPQKQIAMSGNEISHEQ